MGLLIFFFLGSFLQENCNDSESSDDDGLLCESSSLCLCLCLSPPYLCTLFHALPCFVALDSPVLADLPDLEKAGSGRK